MNNTYLKPDYYQKFVPANGDNGCCPENHECKGCYKFKEDYNPECHGFNDRFWAYADLREVTLE